MELRYTIALLIALVLNASANLMLKFGMRRIEAEGGLLQGGIGPALHAMLSTPVVMLGLACFALNAVCYMYALQRWKVSAAYPVMVGGGFAIIALVARLSDLHERMTAAQWLGVVLIGLGVVLVISCQRATGHT